MGAAVRKEYDLFIGGAWRKSGSGKTIDVLNPATGELLTRVPAGDSRDVDAAVAAAREAFVAWGKTSAIERQRILLEIADRIQKRARDYAELETMNVGKPIRESVNIDIPLAIDHYRYFAGVLRNIQGLTQSFDSEHAAPHLARASGGGGAHPSVELPVPAGGVETRALAGGREHGGDEAGGADPPHPPRARQRLARRTSLRGS